MKDGTCTARAGRRWRRPAALPSPPGALVACGGGDSDDDMPDPALVAAGKDIFRFDTFGDEAQWTDALQMHTVIATAVDPTTALSVGLKVDAEALPAAVVAGIQNGSVDLHDPATTVALLKLDAVVGVKGTVETINGQDVLTKVGITCALCHSTVDDSFAPGIGKRLDGWPNLDLDPGAIIALSPAIDAATKTVLRSWGPGRYDPRHNIDGLSKPAVIPPAYGLAGVHSVTATGDGTELAYWNRYVAVTQMGGLGTMDEPRLGLHVTHGNVDLVTAKLPALQAYQLSIAAPAPPAGSFDAAGRRARQGRVRGRGRLRRLPQRLALHRREHAPASAFGFDGRARDAELRRTLGDEAVPDDAAARTVAARAVLPRRLGGDAGRRRRPLRHAARPRPECAAEGRPRRVPEVDLMRAVALRPAVSRASCRCGRSWRGSTPWRTATPSPRDVAAPENAASRSAFASISSRPRVLPGSPLGSSTRPARTRPSRVSTVTLPIQRAGRPRRPRGRDASPPARAGRRHRDRR
jgi:hypothetical protein